ncbi:MAG: hypothetical protein IJS87_03745 [Rhodocyclaceae bacterium]|nr:hypothetical protein [Rhodocyclaceae bacterium]
MKKKLSRIWLALTSLILLTPRAVCAASGEVKQIVIVADTRNLSGIMAWWTNLYNESHGWFTLLTVVIVPLTGILLGMLADLVMKRIGIDLKSRELGEL